MVHASMNAHEQVTLAVKSETPDRVTYTLGWIVANAIVGARYRDSGIDVLPVFHPETGWDRFVITRRVSCRYLAHEASNAFGTIMLSGEDAPRVTAPDGSDRLALGALLRADADRALAIVADLFSPTPLADGDHADCRHARAEGYPTLYAAVTRLILAHPDIVAAREVHVDDQPIDGAFHPLHLHSGGAARGAVYDWFAIESENSAVFVHITGAPAIHERSSRGWAADSLSLATSSADAVRRRIGGWLGIESVTTRFGRLP